MLVVVVDAHTKLLEVQAMSFIMAEVTVEQLRQIYATFGLPEILVTDNALSFTAATFQECMERDGTWHIHTVPYHPPPLRGWQNSHCSQ